MSRSISPPEAGILYLEADLAARRLVRQLHLEACDQSDICHDLIVDALARCKHFDPRRGSIGAFLSTVMANEATRVARRIKAHRRLFGTTPVSLDEQVRGHDGATRGDLVAEDRGYAAMCGQPTDRSAAIDRRIDLERGLATLAVDERELCEELAQWSVEELARRGRGARSSLYRRVGNIRLAFTAAGLRAARNASRAW